MNHVPRGSRGQRAATARVRIVLAVVRHNFLAIRCTMYTLCPKIVLLLECVARAATPQSLLNVESLISSLKILEERRSASSCQTQTRATSILDMHMHPPSPYALCSHHKHKTTSSGGHNRGWSCRGGVRGGCHHPGGLVHDWSPEVPQAQQLFGAGCRYF